MEEARGSFSTGDVPLFPRESRTASSRNGAIVRLTDAADSDVGLVVVLTARLLSRSSESHSFYRTSREFASAQNLVKRARFGPYLAWGDQRTNPRG